MASTVSVRSFLPLVGPHVPAVPIPTVERAIRNAAIEFCERTRCWRHVTSVDVTEQGQALVAPDYAAIHEIEKATWNGQKLTPTQFSDIHLPDYDDTQEGQVPERLTQVGPNTVSLYPFAPGRIDLSMWLKPRGDSDFTRPGDIAADYFNQVPDFLLSQHGEPLSWGALARIMLIPGQPWTDGNLAMAYQVRFREATDGLFDLNTRGQHRAPRRTRIRFC